MHDSPADVFGALISYDCWLAFELIYIYFFIVETKNYTLEETAAYVSIIRAPCLANPPPNTACVAYSMAPKVSKWSHTRLLLLPDWFMIPKKIR